MNAVLAGLILWLAGGLLCLTLGRYRDTLRRLGPVVVVGGAAPILAVALAVLLGGEPVSLQWSWAIPLGTFSLGMDRLSAFFIVPVLIVCASAAVYGAGYLDGHEKGRNVGALWLFFCVLAASMVVVILARNAMLFLMAWELMSLASFFLVVYESELESVRKAGWVYLVATHVGTAFLLVLFVLLGRQAGSWDFSRYGAHGLSAGMAGFAFLLAVIGFGTKAGFMPLHVWLPEAHPAAPSHVSAVMSGVMIKTGIYGLIRILTYLGYPPAWWGCALILIGAVSGILGVLLAMAQHDLKRLLAYHSVENIGIIALGLGLGLLGVHIGNPVVAAAGLAGALLHVVNHAIFKSLLFMGAGSVIRATGTREIDVLGGLLKRMPKTGATFLVGAVAICGLPPLNGFVSEFLIYIAALTAITGSTARVALAAVAVAGSLALIGGLATACFTKVFGIVFLGEPRSEHATRPQPSDEGWRMAGPMVFLAFLCAALGVGGLFAARVALRVVAELPWPGPRAVRGVPYEMPMIMLAALALVLVVIGGILVAARAMLLRRQVVGAAVTWDCGYARPAARMQYTASSFVEPVTRFFNVFLGTRRAFSPLKDLFPKPASFATETPDLSQERMHGPAFAAVDRFLARFRGIQHGRLNLYVMYIVIALIVLLMWKMR